MADITPIRFEKVSNTIVGFSELRANEFINVSYISGLGVGATSEFGTLSGNIAEGNHNHDFSYQPISQGLSSIASVSGIGFLKKTGDTSYIIDSSSYLTENQYITLSGDLSGIGNTNIIASVDSIKSANIPSLSNGFFKYEATLGSFIFDSTTYADDTKVVHNFGNESGLAGNKSWTGTHEFINTTASTSSTTGTIVLSGSNSGLGVAGSVNTGLDSTFNNVKAGMICGGIMLPQVTSEPTSPVLSESLTTYNSNFCNRLSTKSQSGLDRALQHFMGLTSYCLYSPIPGTTNVFDSLSTAFQGGNPSAVTVSTTNARTRQNRNRQQGAAGTNRLVGNYSTYANYTIGTGSGLGGFYYASKFSVADNVIPANTIMFVGLANTVAAPTTAAHSTMINCIGVGKDATDTNFKILYGGSTRQSSIDLGANFPCDTTNDLYLFELYSDPYESNINYRLTRIGTPYKIQGTITATTPGVELPSNTTLLAPRMYRSTTTTSGTVAIEVGHVYIDQLI